MKLKQRPEDFIVREAYRFDEDPRGPYRVYLMDKQKLSTFEAVQRICTRMRIPPAAVSFCGLKDKQGRTEQIIAIRGKDAEMQEPDLRLKFLGRTGEALSARNLTANRFAVTVRDLGEEDVARLASSVAEVRRVGVVNYFDSQRFGGLKHGQGFIAKDLILNQTEHALHNYMAKASPLDQSDDAKVKKFWAQHWGDWERHCPIRAVAKYRNVLMYLRDHPDDWAGAFLQIEPRYRALLIFEYQSWLWNEGVRRLIQGFLPERDLISLRYQAGRLLFPREVPGDVLRDLRERTFPLLGPETEISDERTREAVENTLAREHIRIPDLKLPKLPGMFFKHEERPVLIYPGKLVVSEPRRDEMNRDRLKVNVAFTLPPGAYATLVTKRLFWFAMLEEEALSQGELHPTAAHALESAFGPGGIRKELRDDRPKRRVDRYTAAATTIATGIAAAAVDQKPSHAVEIAAAVAEAPKKQKMGFRERQKRKKDAKAEARAQQPKPAGTGKRAVAKRAKAAAAREPEAKNE